MTLDNINFEQTLAIDIGGSSVKATLISDQWNNRIRLDPIALSERTFASVRAAVVCLAKSHPAKTIAISTPGTVADGIVLRAGNFEDYQNINWSAELKTPVKVINDGRASALAEWHGLATQKGIHIHLVLGTGVGSGIVMDGKLFDGASGNAGHIGHITVTEQTTDVCSCGKQGCAELFAGARNMTSQWEELHPSQNFTDLVQAAKQRDAEAEKIIVRAGFYLGRATSAAMNVINPSSITVGGGTLLALQNGTTNLLFDSLLGSVQESAQRRVLDCQIKPATFGNDGGMLGAALLARDLG